MWLKRDNAWEKRHILCNRALSPQNLARIGKRRWKIEGFFKTAKHRFALHRFAQGTKGGTALLVALAAGLPTGSPAWFTPGPWPYLAYSKDYSKDMDTARANKRGIWAGTFVMPADYRKGRRRTLQRLEQHRLTAQLEHDIHKL